MRSSKSSHWTLDDVKRALKARPEIKGWILDREDTRRRERYFLSSDQKGGTATDQDRSVQQQSTSLRVLVNLEGRPDRQGEASIRLIADVALQPQIDSVIDSAIKTDYQAWDLPTQVPASPPEVKTCDPLLAEDLEQALEQMTSEISQSVEGITRASDDVAFNSAELFLSTHHKQTDWSNGLTHRASQSRIYLESAFSAQSGSKDEYLHARWAVARPELNVREMFHESAQRALATRKVTKPKPGRYWVVVDAEVLNTLFHGQLSHLSGGNAYHGLPHTEVGGELISGAQAPEADLMSWRLDPLLEFGADTGAFSEQGLLQQPLLLVKNNRVVAQTLDQQYASYLKRPATSARGNLVIEGGSLSHADLLRAAPQVLEILQFSGLFADANSGTFSSEIRLARLYNHDTGEITTIKGGSLSGSIQENFTRARLSKEQVRFSHFASMGMGGAAVHGQGYYGPAYALLNDVSIAG